MDRHAIIRARQRTRIDPGYIFKLEKFIKDKPLPQVDLYHPVKGGEEGYIIFKPVGNKHVVSTVYASHMKPKKGVPLSSYISLEGIPKAKINYEKKAGLLDWLKHKYNAANV